jgi:hypothetical protein
MYDRETGKVALKKADKNTPESVELKFRPDKANCGFNSVGFVHWVGLDASKSQTFEVSWNRQINALEFSLKQGRSIPSRKSGTARRNTQSEG